MPLLVWAVDNNGDNLDDAWEAQYGITTNAYDASNLVGWWQLNGTNNTDNAVDRSGNGLNGTLTNFPSVAYGPGLFSNALNFATNSAVGFPTTNSSLNLPNGFTYSAWFQTTNTTSTNETVVTTWQDTGSTGWSVGASSTGVATITFYDGATEQVVQGSGATTSLYDGGWHQLAATLDTNQVAIVYVDGEPEATNTITGWSPGSVGSFTFGETGTNVNNTFNLDEVRLYNRALGTTEVPQLPVTYTDINGSGLTVYDDDIEHLSPLDTNSIVSSSFATSGLTQYYGTSSPTLTKTSGDGQIVSASTFASSSLVVHVVGSSGPLTNAPVTFSIQGGSDGLLSLSSGGGATTSTTLSLTTDSSGNATVYYKAGADTLQNNLIVATAVTQSTSVSVIFTEHCGIQNGLALWLKGDTGVTTDANGNITAWNDQSVSGNNVASPYGTSQTTGRATVLTSSLNGNSVIHLPGSGYQYLSASDTSSLRPSSAITMISVMRPTSTSGSYSWLLNKGNSGTAYYGIGVYPSTSDVIGNAYAGSNQLATSSTPYVANQPYLVADVYDGAHQTVYQSGQSVVSSTLTGSLTSSSGYPLYIGYGGTTYTGDVGEVMVYSRALSSSELSAVQGYLADKWGVYAPSATWPSAYSSAEQTLIASNQWNKAQADTYAALATANPTIPVDMALWLKGDAGVTTDVNGNITAWNDQSIWGNSVLSPYTVSQTTGRATVLTNGLNSKTLIHMPGGSYQYLSANDSSSLRPSSAVTIVSVMRPTATSASYSWLLNKGNSGTAYYGLGVYPSTSKVIGEIYAGSNQLATSSAIYTPVQPYLVADVYDGAHQTIYQSGQSVVSSALTGSMTSSSGYPLYIGYGGTTYTGDVGEVIVYNRALSSAELTSVQGYMADKWGVYAPSATWPSAYSSAEQTLIASNQWTKAQADTYSALVTANPTIPVDMALWLKGDTGVTTDVNGNITAWNDQSVWANSFLSPYTVSQTTGRATVLTNSLNGNPVVHLPGAGTEYLSANDSPTLEPSSAITVVSVMRPTTASGSTSWLLSKGGSSAYYGLGVYPSTLKVIGNVYAASYQTATASPTYTVGQPYLVADVYDGAHQTLYQSGQSVSSTALTGSLVSSSGYPLYLGYGGTTYTGDVGEIMVYGRALSSTELTAVQGYLADKWGVYAPSATWPSAYTGAVQSLIATNQWTKAQANAYVALSTANPTIPVDMALWLKGDTGVTTDVNGNITAWNDQSVWGNNVLSPYGTSQTTGRSTVLTNSLNSKSVIHMPGAGYQYLSAGDSSSLRPGSAMTIVSVMRPVAGASGSTSWLLNKGSTSPYYGLGVNPSSLEFIGDAYAASNQTATSSTPYIASQPYLVADVYDGAHQTVYQSGQSVVSSALTGSMTSSSGYPLYLGYGGTAYTGDVGEVMVYGRALSSTELTAVQEYLADKWGVYAPSATWPSAYSSAEQSLISSNQWTKAQADTYAALATANPAMPVDMALWLKGDTGVTTDVNGNITAWNDQSAFGNNVISPCTISQTTGRSTPLTNSLNGKSVVHLPGTAYSWLSAPDNQAFRSTHGVTIISVMRPSATNTGSPNAVLEKGYSPTSYNFGVNSALQITSSVNVGSDQYVSSSLPYTPNQPVIAAEIYDGTNETLYQAGQSVGTISASGTPTYPSAAPLYIGYSGTEYSGDLGEIILFNRALTSTELSAVQGYLSDKWGLYTPSATWPNSYSSAVQTLIAANQWTKTETDAYVAAAEANPSMPMDMALWLKADGIQGGQADVLTDTSGNVTQWTDESVNHNNALAVTTSTTSRAQFVSLPSGKAVSFVDNFHSPLSIPDSSSLRPSNGVTVFVVTQPGYVDSESNTGIIGKQGAPVPYSIMANITTQICSGASATSSSGGVAQSVAESLTYSLGASNLLTYAYNGSNQTLTQLSNLKASATLTGSIVNTAGSQPVTIGSASNCPGVYYPGTVSEVLVYDRALTALEAAEVASYLSVKYGLVAVPPPIISGTAGGNYTSATTVSFTSSPSGLDIRYTLDGTTPTSSSTLYAGSIPLSQSAPLTFAYFYGGRAVSAPGVAQYYVSDTNQIGISDAWQTTYFGHLLTSTQATAQSPGGSGLTNLQDYLYGYNPTLYSTNGDGLSDLTNYNLGYSATNTDINGYGLTNAQQLALGLDPFDTGVNPTPPSPPTPVTQSPPIITIDLPTNAISVP